MSLRDELLGHRVPSERVKLPGGEVEVRGLTVREKDRFEKAVEAGAPFRAAFLIMTVFDPGTGEPVFTEDDAEAIASAPVAAFEPALRTGIRLSAYTDKDLEELEGN